MSAITIPEGFFPPPGVPFATEAQRDLAISLHFAGLVKVQWLNRINEWDDIDDDNNDDAPNHYRLAPTAEEIL